MKGLCPGCDEEVYTFFDDEEKGEGRGSIVEHECHCCGARLVFESKRESNREGQNRADCERSIKRERLV